MIKKWCKPNLSYNTYALGKSLGKYVIIRIIRMYMKKKVKFNIENNENYIRIHMIKQ